MQRLLAVSAVAAERAVDWALKFLLALLPIGWAWHRARRKKQEAQSAARAHDRALLYALAEVAQIQLDEQRWHDYVTSTGRVRPMPEGELAERHGSFKQRRLDAAELLWQLQGNDSRREPRRQPIDYATQDVLAPEHLEDSER